METILGTVASYPYTFVPMGWLPCDGQLLQIAQHQALFSLIGTVYGGDGKTSFALPNLNGGNGAPTRVVAGQGQGPGLSARSLGETLGADQQTLTEAQLPAHGHAMAMAATGPGASAAPLPGAALVSEVSDGFLPAPVPQPTQFSPEAMAAAGGGAPHANDQPALGLIYCIAVTGIYPSFS